MGQRSQALAEQLEQVNRQITATIERCSDAQWKTKTSGEKWPVGVVAHHVAQSHEGIAGLVRMIAGGQPLPPITMEMIDHGNAEHAKQFANVTRDETLALMKKNAAAAVSAVRGLSDEQLDRSATVLGGSMTAQQAIERILIGHVQGHHDSIKAAVGAK
jgi:uncharacterized damage-inducible protein DinB